MLGKRTAPKDWPLHAEYRKATKSSLRERNRRLVLQHVLAGWAVSRADIARATRLTRATVSGLVADLLELRLLREVGLGAASAAGGKRPTILEVDGGAYQVVCVDASSDPIRAGRVGLDGHLITTAEASRRGAVGDDLLAGIAGLVEKMCAEATGTVLATAVGTPGLVSGDAVVVQAANLGWSDLDLGAALANSALGRVLVLNDAQASALAEFALAPDRRSGVVSVLVGGGIGAGIVLGGRLYRGESSSAGEIGHLDVRTGAECSCGQRGCLETVASLPSLLGSDGYQALRDARTVEAVAAVFDAVDEATWDRAAGGMATALAALVAVLDVLDVVIGGPITAAGPQYLQRVQHELDARMLPGRRGQPVVRFSELKENSVLLGAASYALHQELGVGWTS